MVEVELLKDLKQPGFTVKSGARLLFSRIGTAEGFVRRGMAGYVDDKPKPTRKVTASTNKADTTAKKTSFLGRSEEDAPSVTE